MDQARTSVSSSGQMYMEGFLIKRGHVRHNWKTRWFKLSDTSMRYYKKQHHTVPQGRIALKGARLDKHVIFSTEEKDKGREHVFMITTAQGSEYPIQAATSAEHEIWTEIIDAIIERLSNNNLDDSVDVPLSPTSLSTDSTDESEEMRRSAELIVKMSCKEGGVTRVCRTIDGIRYTQGFSGTELQSWMWKNMGLNGNDADSTVASLMRVGLLDCLTPDLHLSPFSEQHYYRLLSDDLSMKNGTSPPIQSPTSPTKPVNSPVYNPHKLKKLQALKQKDSSGLPQDLPVGDVIKRGILFKRGHVVPSWKARCFVLQDHPSTLSYFDPAKKSAKTINSLELHGATVFTVGKIAAEVALGMKNPPSHLFCVKVACGTLYLITATSDTERNEWIQAIKPLCRRKRED